MILLGFECISVIIVRLKAIKCSEDFFCYKFFMYFGLVF